MRLGVIVPSMSDGSAPTPGWPAMRSFATHAEAVGLDSLWVCDHLLFRFPERPEGAAHEVWTILSALAATTSRVELGQLVLCASFRNPGLTAKMAAAADEVSDGRLILGVGAGWHDPEYAAFGFPTDHRASRFDEALQIIAPLLRGERVTVDGRYHRTEDAVLLPAPRRRVPILVAGRGPRMLALTARHADAWNTAWFGMPDGQLDQRLADLRAALDAEGRDPATLRLTVGMEWDLGRPDRIDGGSADAMARAFEAYDRLGVDDLIISLDPATEAMLDLVAEARAIWGG